ncbi:MAG: hypothetical protein GY847_05000 [Proteobacteria bacterium]|nr:hypothetical protein [Pseudomonadota bacterium]
MLKSWLTDFIVVFVYSSNLTVKETKTESLKGLEGTLNKGGRPAPTGGF